MGIFLHSSFFVVKLTFTVYMMRYVAFLGFNIVL